MIYKGEKRRILEKGVFAAAGRIVQEGGDLRKNDDFVFKMKVLAHLQIMQNSVSDRIRDMSRPHNTSEGLRNLELDQWLQNNYVHAHYCPKKK